MITTYLKRRTHRSHVKPQRLIEELAILAVMVSISGGAWSEISRGAAVKYLVVAALWYFLRGAALQQFVKWGGCFDFFCGGYLDITWHLLESCFTAFLRGLHLLHILRRLSLRHFLGGAALWHFLVVDASRHFLERGLLCDIFEGGPGATAPLAPYKNHHCILV